MHNENTRRGKKGAEVTEAKMTENFPQLMPDTKP